MLRVLLTVLLFAGATRADDKCLTGASTLGDQRGLATLHGALDTTCPCDASGLTRATYRACAKGVVASALAATLRSACRSTAGRLYKNAICGTTKIACGRFTPTSAKKPMTCRVKPATQCHDKGHFEETATPQDFCADVVDWTASTGDDPRAAGPFGAGVRVVTLSKPSVVDPMQTRVLNTVVWYPTAPGAGPVDSGYGAVLNAPLEASGGPYPVVMFSHGSCGVPTQSKFLWPLVASRGFVVVAPPHPGNTLAEFPQCGAAQALVAAALERPQDILFALDQMLAASADPLSPFFGALDATRIGMAGHSFGGWTTYKVMPLDARFKVAVPMAPAVPAGVVPLTVPSLTMLSTLDTYVDEAAIRTQFAAAASPKFEIELRNTGHFAYSDNCFPSPDCNPPATLTQDEAHAAVLRWIPPFLERYLAGDPGFAPFFVLPAPPGAVLTALP